MTLEEMQALIQRADRGVAAVRLLAGEPDLQVTLHTGVDWQSMVRQLLPIALAAKVVSDMGITEYADDGTLVCRGCDAFIEDRTVHQNHCPVKALTDALKALETESEVE